MAADIAFGIPKARLQSLSDLIFGLALSIGAFALINSNASSPGQILPNIFAFGFSFLILITVWARYTRLTSVLPFETRATVVLNVVMLFFVAVEPYLFNQLFTFTASASVGNLTEVYYSVDLAAVFLCLGYLTHVLLTGERTVPSSESDRYFATTRNLELISGVVFLISTLPIFWTTQVFGNPLRVYVWLLPLVLGRAGRTLTGAMKRPSQQTSGPTIRTG